jgi:hypothetical protein
VATFNPRAARRMHAVLPARGAGLATVDHALPRMPSRPRTAPMESSLGIPGSEARGDCGAGVCRRRRLEPQFLILMNRARKAQSETPTPVIG